MKLKSTSSLILSGSLLLTTIPTNAAEEFYEVKEGEIFSRIARKQFGKPTYSEAGALEKLKSLNPEIKNIHQLNPGQKLRISEAETKETPSTSSDVVIQPEPQSTQTIASESRGEIAPTFKFVTLKTVEKSSNTHTDILSKYYVEIPVTLEQKYHAKISIYERLSLSSVKFSGLQGDSSRDQNFLLWGAALGLKYDNFKSFEIFGEMGLEPMLFAKDVVRSSFKMTAINLPNAKLGLQRVLFDFNEISFGAKAHVASYFGGSNSSVTVNSGSGFGGGIYLRKTLPNSVWGLNFGVDKIYQDTSLFQQKRTDFNGMLKYEFKFF
jgi:hypothetical protein